jgi:hypothetical protein
MTKADGPNHLPVGEKRKTAKPFNVSFARAGKNPGAHGRQLEPISLGHKTVELE